MTASNFDIGLIDWYNENKGFGLLKTLDEKEAFLHVSNWKDNNPLLPEQNVPLFFEISFLRGRDTAIKCRYFNPQNRLDWEVFFEKGDELNANNGHTQQNFIQAVANTPKGNCDYSIITSTFRSCLVELSKENLFNRNNLFIRLLRCSSNKEFQSFLFDLISSHVNTLSDSSIFTFWKQGILPGFAPKQIVLLNHFEEISNSELSQLENQETKNLIIIKKLEKLKSSFDTSGFLAFSFLLEMIDSGSLKTKIVSDLQELGSIQYFEIVSNSIKELTSKPEINFTHLKELVEQQPKFLDDQFKSRLVKILEASIIQNCSFKTIADCLEGGLIENLNDTVISRIGDQSIEDLVFFLRCQKCKDYRVSVLDHLLEIDEFEILLDECKRLSDDVYNHYDGLVVEKLSEEQYFELWNKGKGSVTPLNYLREYLNHNGERYLELRQWEVAGIISVQNVEDLLIQNVRYSASISDRYEFYRVYFSIKYLIEHEYPYLELLSPEENEFVNLMLWHFQKKEELDFQTLKGKYIFFRPEDQVDIFQRLFYLKHKGKLDFDLDSLDEIVRADFDLFLTNEKFHTDFVLDISTHVILECLISYSQTNSFAFKSDLILKDLKRNAKRKFQIGKYFDACEGRLTPKWNWNIQGRISDVHFGDDKYYYAIEFAPGREVQGRNYYGTYTYFEANPNFDNLKEAVKRLPDRKWNPNASHWGVPSKYKEEVYQFAREHRFLIDLKGQTKYACNPHLAEFTRNIRRGKEITDKKNIPDGITICEGRKANTLHKTLQKEFWWCANQECYQNCVETHYEEDNPETHSPWKNYTLFDFLRILKINTDEAKGAEIITDGHYYKFLGQVNAFNRLLKRLYCEGCGNLLQPLESSHFALYRDVRFHCDEENCTEQHKVIYLNSCLYGECNSIIDSRVSKQCDHGLYICSNCGTCCSEEFFKRRFESLEKVGGYIYPDLRTKIERGYGHLEKAEYYCYSCAGMMTPEDDDRYRCDNCQTTYDLGKFKWLSRKWTKTNKRRSDYPTRRIDPRNN